MNIENMKDALLSAWQEPKKRRFFYLALIIVLLLAMMHACSNTASTAKKSYRVARDATWYGIDLHGKETNMVAFTDELLTMISQIADIELTLIDVGSANLFFGLERGQWNGVLAAYSPASDVSQKYLASEPFFNTGFALVVKPNSPLKDFSALEGKIVGIPADITLVGPLAQQKAIFTPYSRLSKGIEDLLSNRIDGLIADYNSAIVNERSLYFGQIKIVAAIFIDKALRLVTLHDATSAPLIEDFNAALKKLKENGSYHKLLLRWNLVTP